MKTWKVYNNLSNDDDYNATDKLWSEKLTWAFGSGKLKNGKYFKKKFSIEEHVSFIHVLSKHYDCVLGGRYQLTHINTIIKAYTVFKYVICILKKQNENPKFIAENIIGNNFSIKLSINIFIQVETTRVELNHSCGSCFQNMTTPFWLKILNSNLFSFITNGVVRFTVQINIETICQSKCIYMFTFTIHHYDLSPCKKDGHTCWTPRLLAMTMPPILVTLSASLGSSALWSSVSLMALPSRHRITLVSPTCAMCNLIPWWRRHTVAVVPQLYTGVSVY